MTENERTLFRYIAAGSARMLDVFKAATREHEEALRAAREEGRAEGFAAAREMAADMADAACNEAKRRKKDCDTTTPMGRTMHRINEAQEDILGPLADDIRAMQDGRAGEG